MTGTTLGHYEIIESLGAGGMGEVYAAEDTRLQRRVAIKVLRRDVADDEERLQRFEREAKAVAALDHPNIVTVHSFEEARTEDGDRVHFITMQLVEGVPLTERIPPRGMTVERLLELAIPLADAVSAAHQHGIVHRDLKPANIMVSSEGRVRVLDFGLAKLWEGPDGAAENFLTDLPTGSRALMTEEGVILGTGAYMSPEQAEGKELDQRTDIFSLGILLYEMATGERPFQGDTRVSVISSIMKDTPASVAEVNPALPRHLGRIVKLCLEKDPERRFQSAKDLRNQLIELREEILSGGHGPPPSGSGPSWWSRSSSASAGGSHGAGPLTSAGSATTPARRARIPLVAAGLAIALLAVLVLAWPSLRSLLAGGTSSAALPARKDVAILTIAAADGDEAADAFVEGLRDTLSRRLARITDDLPVSVIPADRARQVTSIERAEIEQGVNLTLGGSLERTRMLARLQLILSAAGDGRVLRETGIEVARGDPLELTERALLETAELLDLDLLPAQRRELTGFGTDVPAVYDLYLRALGHLGAGTGDGTEAAIALLQQAATLDPGFAAGAAALGTAHWARHDETDDPESLREATAACQRALELDDRLADGHLCAAKVAESAGDLEGALAGFERAVYLEPTHDEAIRGLAGTYAQLGRVAEAEETYRTALELRPHYWPVYADLAVFYYVEGRLEEAAAMFREVAERAPRYRVGQSSLGGLYTLLGRYEDGVAALERALELDPSGAAYSNLATTYFALRRFGDAIAAYQEAIRFEPESPMSWGNLGDAYYWAPGERDNAPAAYERALALVRAELEGSPQDANAISDLAKFTGMLGDREAALEHLEAAIDLAPRDPQILYHGVLIHLRQGDRDAALDYLERAAAAGYSKHWIRDSPELDALRESPRFRALLEGL